MKKPNRPREEEESPQEKPGGIITNLRQRSRSLLQKVMGLVNAEEDSETISAEDAKKILRKRFGRKNVDPEKLEGLIDAVINNIQRDEESPKNRDIMETSADLMKDLENDKRFRVMSDEEQDDIATAVDEVDDKGIEAKIEAIERVQSARRGRPIRNDKPTIGRNSQCPCGSGRKYKNCCMRKAPEVKNGKTEEGE